jgi:hypothetical protein
MSVLPELRRLMQLPPKFKDNLHFIARFYLTKKQNKTKQIATTKYQWRFYIRCQSGSSDTLQGK